MKEEVKKVEQKIQEIEVLTAILIQVIVCRDS